VKAGAQVLVSVRRAIGGKDLGQLRQAVEREFLTLDAHEQSIRSTIAKMETDLLRRMARFQDE
jgi:F-type H+-transporting ATPase subunit epsilon